MPLDLQWFAKDGEGGEKTEEPTGKKLNDARNDGKVAKSKELNNAVGLIILFIMLQMLMSSLGGGMLGMFDRFYGLIPDFIGQNPGGPSGRAVSQLLGEAMRGIISMVLPFFIVGVIAMVILDILQVKWKITTKPMQPKLSKFNPMNGIKRIFSKDSLIELLKSIAKIILIAVITYMSVQENLHNLLLLYDISLMRAVMLVGSIVLDTGLRISLAYLVLGFADLIYQKWKFHEEMKMTKQEVKDEYKMTEGNPEIKGRIRKIQRQMAFSRMMQNVPEADVVIRNPTHFAVALKYDPNKHGAPLVLAKGQDYQALRIVKLAEEHGVFILENRPLARALYASCEVEREIPAEFYGAVAEVLVYIYRVSHREEMLQ